MKSLTIIIPVYNNIDILESMKNKILFLSNNYTQTIVIDDCSRDNTYLELYNFIKNNNLLNIEIYRNNLNMGPSYSRNIGIEKALGEYIAFLDSDDDWHPQKIAIQIDYMKKNNVLLCGTEHIVINSDADLLIQKEIDYGDCKIPILCYKWPNILFKSKFATPSVVMHKSLKDYRFDESMRYSEDYNLWKRISYKHKAIKIMLPLTYTFKHDYLSESSSLSSNLWKMQFGLQNSYMKLLCNKDIKIKDKSYLVIAMLFSWIKYMRRVFLFLRYKVDK